MRRTDVLTAFVLFTLFYSYSIISKTSCWFFHLLLSVFSDTSQTAVGKKSPVASQPLKGKWIRDPRVTNKCEQIEPCLALL